MKYVCFVMFVAVLLAAGPAGRLAEASEPAAQAAGQTIATEEVKDAAAEADQQVSPAQVEKARAVTADRLYGLAGFWLLIVLAILLIRFQVRDDEKLYREGYYPTGDE